MPKVQIWSQKPTPLVAAVFQIGLPQAGKSRLFAVLEEVFDTCDDVIASHVHDLLVAAFQARSPPSQGVDAGAQRPVTVKSITLQSFTMPEFLARCSSTYPQVVFEDGDPRALLGIPLDVWKGRAFNLDESYDPQQHTKLFRNEALPRRVPTNLLLVCGCPSAAGFPRPRGLGATGPLSLVLAAWLIIWLAGTAKHIRS